MRYKIPISRIILWVRFPVHLLARRIHLYKILVRAVIRISPIRTRVGHVNHRNFMRGSRRVYLIDEM